METQTATEMEEPNVMQRRLREKVVNDDTGQYIYKYCGKWKYNPEIVSVKVTERLINRMFVEMEIYDCILKENSKKLIRVSWTPSNSH